jgi:hypothetical protein
LSMSTTHHFVAHIQGSANFVDGRLLKATPQKTAVSTTSSRW